LVVVAFFCIVWGATLNSERDADTVGCRRDDRPDRPGQQRINQRGADGAKMLIARMHALACVARANADAARAQFETTASSGAHASLPLVGALLGAAA